MVNKPANNLLAMLAARNPVAERKVAEEKAEKEAGNKAFEERCYRRLERFKRWGMKQEKEELAEHFSLAVLLLIESQKTARLREEGHSLMQRHVRTIEARSVAAQDAAREFAAKAFAAQAARKKGAANKLAKDPKQAAKAGALELWKERNAGKHPKLRRVQDFATEVMRRWPALTNAKTIEGWSAQWTKEVRAGKTPTC